MPYISLEYASPTRYSLTIDSPYIVVSRSLLYSLSLSTLSTPISSRNIPI